MATSDAFASGLFDINGVGCGDSGYIISASFSRNHCGELLQNRDRTTAILMIAMAVRDSRHRAQPDNQG